MQHCTHTTTSRLLFDLLLGTDLPHIVISAQYTLSLLYMWCVCVCVCVCVFILLYPTGNDYNWLELNYTAS